MDEEWRSVVGWEGLYEVSSLGRVRSVDRIVRTVEGVIRPLRGRVLVTGASPRGYQSVTLAREGIKITSRVHRLVCESFHGPPPIDKPLVLHGPRGVSDNSANNLRWGDHSENTNDSVRDGTNSHSRKIACKRNHAFDEKNTGIRKSPTGTTRKCLRCHADWQSYYEGRGLHPDILMEKRTYNAS